MIFSFFAAAWAIGLAGFACIGLARLISIPGQKRLDRRREEIRRETRRRLNLR